MLIYFQRERSDTSFPPREKKEATPVSLPQFPSREYIGFATEGTLFTLLQHLDNLAFLTEDLFNNLR